MLLHLNHRVLLLLLGLLLSRLRLALLEHLLGSLGHHARQLNLDLRWQLLVFGRQGHTQLLLDLHLVCVANVLGNVRHHGRLQLGSLGVLADQLHDDGVLHRGHVHLDVGLMVLVEERFDRLALEHGHVLGHGVTGLLVVRQGHELIGILDTQNLQHPTVEFGQVVDLRGHLCHLDHSLVLHNALTHGRGIGIAHGDDVDVSVVFPLGSAWSIAVWVVVVVRVCVVLDDVGQQVQLLFEAVVHPCLYGGHDLELALQQSQCCPHGRLCAHV